MIKYCCLCRNEGKPLCYKHCDIINQGWYEFSLLHWVYFTGWWLLMDIKIWWWIFIANKWDEDWWKDNEN
jgi:hypothetical protein